MKRLSLEQLLAEYIKNNKLKEQQVNESYINGLLHAANENFNAAYANLGKFNETSFKAAYDGLLQLSRAIIFVNGYRPNNGAQHKTTFEVAIAFLGTDLKSHLRKLDKFRKRRNENIYHPIDLISQKEAESIIKRAKEYYPLVKEYLINKNAQYELFEME